MAEAIANPCARNQRPRRTAQSVLEFGRLAPSRCFLHLVKELLIVRVRINGRPRDEKLEIEDRGVRCSISIRLQILCRINQR
jgi:hypothetical protein